MFVTAVYLGNEFSSRRFRSPGMLTPLSLVADVSKDRRAPNLLDCWTLKVKVQSVLLLPAFLQREKAITRFVNR